MKLILSRQGGHQQSYSWCAHGPRVFQVALQKIRISVIRYALCQNPPDRSWPAHCNVRKAFVGSGAERAASIKELSATPLVWWVAVAKHMKAASFDRMEASRYFQVPLLNLREQRRS